MAQLDLTNEQINILFSKVHISGLIDIEWVRPGQFCNEDVPFCSSCPFPFVHTVCSDQLISAPLWAGETMDA